MAQTTREQLIEHIRKTQQPTGEFGGDGWRKPYEVFGGDRPQVWWGRKLWLVPPDIAVLAVLKKT